MPYIGTILMSVCNPPTPLNSVLRSQQWPDCGVDPPLENGESTDHIGWMTIHAPKLLTPEELASLIEVAVTAPVPQIPPAHFGKGLRRGPRTGWGPWGVWVLIGHRQDIPASMLPQKPHCVTASLWA